jgi:HlyD family secretion protein
MVDLARAPKPKTGKYVLYGVGVVALIGITIFLAKLEPAAPTIERSIVSIDSVRQGNLVVEVRGPGTLVPEHIRNIPAMNSGRVDKIVAQVGQTVTPETVLLEMSNPDVDIAAMQAQQAYNAERSNLANLKVNLQRGLLGQQTAVASAKTGNVTASQQAAEADRLLEKRLISTFDHSTRKAAAEEAATRYSVAQRELDLMRSTIDSQIALTEQNVDRLKQIAAYRENLKASMIVRAGDVGVLQEMSFGASGQLIEPGQWLNSGMTIAKVVQPGKLKAVIRIPETQAKDVVIGQPASIDTRSGVVKGRVARIDPAPVGGTVSVDIALEGPLPAAARPNLNVDGNIETRRLTNVVYTGRPTYGQDGATIGLFKLDPDGQGAQRVQVKLGLNSVSAVQIVSGLVPGDKVILSDMTQWENSDRVKIK